MKKLLLAIAVGFAAISCNNSPDTTTVKTDSTTIVTDTTKVMMDTTKVVDTSGMKKDTIKAK